MPHNLPLVLIGLMTIIVGFWGFLMACLIVPGEGWSWFSDTWGTIYGTPTTLSTLAFNILMAFAGGIIGAWMVTRDPFWMMSAALGGIISCAAGLDLWWPPMAFAIAFVAGAICKPCADILERMGIDDAVGAVTIHGVLGIWGVMVVGIFLSGYPALQGDAGVVQISFVGQLVGCIVMLLLGLRAGLCGVADLEDDGSAACRRSRRSRGPGPDQGAGRRLSGMVRTRRSRHGSGHRVGADQRQVNLRRSRKENHHGFSLRYLERRHGRHLSRRRHVVGSDLAGHFHRHVRGRAVGRRQARVRRLQEG
jgi:hypothetical protein